MLNWSDLSSANALNLVESKILSFSKELIFYLLDSNFVAFVDSVN